MIGDPSNHLIEKPMQSSGINAIDALAYRSWNAGPGMALTLTYSFLATPPANAIPAA